MMRLRDFYSIEEKTLCFSINSDSDIFFLFTRGREIIENITKYPLYTLLHNC